MYSRESTLREVCVRRHSQEGPGIANDNQGLIFFEMTPGPGVARYVSRCLTIYSNGISIYV